MGSAARERGNNILMLRRQARAVLSRITVVQQQIRDGKTDPDKCMALTGELHFLRGDATELLRRIVYYHDT